MADDEKDSKTKKVELKISLAALVVSIVAILLTQFRPLHEVLDKPELRLAVQPNIEAGNTLGHLELTRYATVSNTGRKAGTALRTEMFIVRLDAGNFEKVLPATFVSIQRPQFFANPGSVRVPWHPVTIAADSDWTSYIVYSQTYSVDEMRAGSALLSKAQADLTKTTSPTGQPTGQMSDETFTALSRLVDTNLDGFGVGRYGVLIYFWNSDSAAPQIDKCEVMDVSDIHMKTFHDNVQRNRTGAGLIYPNGGPIPTFVVNTQNCDTQTTEQLKSRFKGRKPS